MTKLGRSLRLTRLFSFTRASSSGKVPTGVGRAPCVMNETKPGTDLIFVYGSLLPKAPHNRYHLLGPVTSVGPGSLNGRLYSLGDYPGAVASEHPQDFVRGEIYRLENPAEALARLDRYEGFVPMSPDGCEFVRTTAEITLDQGGERVAWVYYYNLPLDGLLRIERGDYLQFVASRD